jgi:hypothetical protein
MQLTNNTRITSKIVTQNCHKTEWNNKHVKGTLLIFREKLHLLIYRTSIFRVIIKLLDLPLKSHIYPSLFIFPRKLSNYISIVWVENCWPNIIILRPGLVSSTEDKHCEFCIAGICLKDMITSWTCGTVVDLSDWHQGNTRATQEGNIILILINTSGYFPILILCEWSENNEQITFKRD